LIVKDSTADRDRRTRRLRNLVEPIACSSIFSPEAGARYVELGFPPSELRHLGVQMPHFDTYVATRAACLGDTSPEVVAAAFAIFKPERIVATVERAQGIASTDEIQEARRTGATEALGRLLPGVQDDALARAAELLRRATDALIMAGRPMFSGLRSLRYTGEPLADLWHSADLYREHRGDSNISSWTARGLDGAQSCLINDLAQGLPLKSYVKTRGWSDDELDVAVTELTERGLVREGQLTEEGRAFREGLESDNDRQQRPALDALGRDVEELFDLLAPWARTIHEQGGYPGKDFVVTLRRWA
jgi:hypothetical protein